MHMYTNIHLYTHMYTHTHTHTCIHTKHRVNLDPLPVEVRFKDITMSISYIHAAKLKFGKKFFHKARASPELQGVCVLLFVCFLASLCVCVLHLLFLTHTHAHCHNHTHNLSLSRTPHTITHTLSYTHSHTHTHTGVITSNRGSHIQSPTQRQWCVTFRQHDVAHRAPRGRQVNADAGVGWALYCETTMEGVRSCKR